MLATRTKRVRGLLLIVETGLVAAGSVLLILNAGGNVFAYILAATLLLLSAYFLVGALVRWRQATDPRGQ
ncbi:hypothetical protein [Micromonospora peucetia]|uniref:Uncharacterized protein n=1 Tax=Micromonospora peucetia TaxID=47871 RepID=A0A1C6W4L8_9ACTN|nr:hypothetical protein [Micromonospora peucetia]SCL73519.1 hypothetical protein GA0070608_5812 [Micromonospora peucetia]